MIFEHDIFRIDNHRTFESAAMETFRFQAAELGPYREYLGLIGCDPAAVKHTCEIPFLPIQLFKSHNIYCGTQKAEAIFTSSSTTGMQCAHHPMHSLALYEQTFRTAFSKFYGNPKQWSIYGLLPNYLEREGSSLVYMVDRLIADCGSGGFYLHNFEALLETMYADPKPKILLGVSYALWDLAERYAPKLRDTIVMETGGMKGQREELPKAEFHNILCEGFGVEVIHSEYGMAELTSQAYSQGAGIFRAPNWMRVFTREINDPFDIQSPGMRGGINIIDLANRYSCAFIQTQDAGRLFDDGSFEIQGRIDHSEIRGCNLLVQ